MSDHPRDRILEIARDLLQQQNDSTGDGPALTIGRVAAAAHVSRATVYRYFSDKTALLQAAGAANGGEQRPVDPRGRIIEAALDVFGERGLHAATLAEIAAQAGLTLSGLHWHFKNKDELVRRRRRVAAADVDADDRGDPRRERRHRLRVPAHPDRHGRPALDRSAPLDDSPDHVRVGHSSRTWHGVAREHTIGRFFPMLVALFEWHARRGTLRPGPARVRAQMFVGGLLAAGPASAGLRRPAGAGRRGHRSRVRPDHGARRPGRARGSPGCGACLERDTRDGYGDRARDRHDA